MTHSWIDRILLGPEAIRRAEAAERRYQAAVAVRSRIDEDLEQGRRELDAAVKEATGHAAKVAQQVPKPSIAAAVEQLAGDEGIVEADVDADADDERRESEPPPAAG